MKNSKFFITILILLNVFLVISVFSIFMRMNKLDNDIKEITSLVDEGSDGNNTIEEIRLKLKDYENLEERLSDLESKGSMDERQKIIDIDNNINRIEHIAFSQDDISIKYGKIKEIQENENIILEIKETQENENSTLKIKDMQKNKNITLKIKEHDSDNDGYSSDLVSLKLADNCRTYFYSEIGLVQSTIGDLMDKVATERSANFEDDYTFIIINNKVVQVYQGYWSLD